MPADVSLPGQENETLALSILCEALDGDDPVRLDLALRLAPCALRLAPCALRLAPRALRLALIQPDSDRAAVLEKYRLNGLPDVWRS